MGGLNHFLTEMLTCHCYGLHIHAHIHSSIHPSIHPYIHIFSEVSISFLWLPFVPHKVGYCSSVAWYFLLVYAWPQSLKLSVGRRGANVFILSMLEPRIWSQVGNKRWLLLGGSKCIIFVVVSYNGGAWFGPSREMVASQRGR